MMKVNLCCAWLLILLGFVSGAALGMFFHKEHWLGGYSSFRRRLLRLGHISFFGLGALNLLFHFTCAALPMSTLLACASVAMLVGGFAMPVSCAVVAFIPQLRMLFALPVLGLLLGGALTFIEVIKL